MTQDRARNLRVGSLARVEGESALRLSLRGNRVTAAQLAIYEPPRFFEAFLRGRSHTEPPDLTSRICGICPIAYQLSASRAIEQACGIEVDGQIDALRRLMYYGEWIESHALHIYMLHAPDFLGRDSGIELARTHRIEIERGLRLKHAGNTVIELLGGRAVHPVNIRVGGLHRAPDPRELRPLAEQLRRAGDDAAETIAWVAGFDFPDAWCGCALLALAEPGRYAIDSGTPTVMRAPDEGVPSERDLALPTRTFPLEEFTDHVVETQVPHSTALHSHLDGRVYLTGPLARYAISGSRLSPVALQAARDAGLGDPREGTACRNPYRSIVVRAVEVFHAVDEALRIIEAYEPPSRPHHDADPRPGSCHGATEAPRGLLYHRYTLDENGMVTQATLIPPTSQNQGMIEADLRSAVDERLDRGPAPDEELTALCERVIRNHDPCISCATHFLALSVDRT